MDNPSGGMAAQIYQPEETSVGCPAGRDAIFLDRLYFEARRLTIEGMFAGNLLAPPSDRDLPFRLEFLGVLAFHVLELDSWESAHWMPGVQISSFFRVEGSTWLADLGGKVTPDHRHFVLATYDDVVEIACETYHLMVD